MGENDNIKDEAGIDVTDGSTAENIDVVSENSVENTAAEYVKDDSYAADVNDTAGDSCAESETVSEPEAYEKNVKDIDTAEPEEQKDHKADLAGYRAYKKRNINSDDVVSEDSVRRVRKPKIQSAQMSNIPIYAIALAVFVVIDLFIMHLFASNQSYNVSDKILSALGFDALHFTDITYEQICLGLGYFVSFIIGGVVILILLKIVAKLFECFKDFRIGKYIPIVLLGTFTVIFLVGFITSYFSNDALLIKSVFKWGAPTAAYLGGLIFYGASKLHVGIEY